MTSHDFNRAILDDVAHRPWPMPDGPWLITQTWHDLLFAHWPVDRAAVRALVPRAFELDLFDGTAWLGIVPFRMSNVAPRGVPSLPGLSEFPELNVRTYVRVDDRPGVYFFSLDATSRLAVRAARMLLNLPYFTATMTVTRDADVITFESRRHGSLPEAELAASYQPVGPPSPPVRGTVEYFLTERYCLYHVGRSGAPYRLDIHHPPWPLQPAGAEIRRNSVADAAGLRLPASVPLLHFSGRQDMVAWSPVSL